MFGMERFFGGLLMAAAAAARLVTVACGCKITRLGKTLPSCRLPDAAGFALPKARDGYVRAGFTSRAFGDADAASNGCRLVHVCVYFYMGNKYVSTIEASGLVERDIF